MTLSFSCHVASGLDSDRKKRSTPQSSVTEVSTVILSEVDIKPVDSTLLSPKDKEVMASASAFTQVLKSRYTGITVCKIDESL